MDKYHTQRFWKVSGRLGFDRLSSIWFSNLSNPLDVAGLTKLCIYKRWFFIFRRKARGQKSNKKLCPLCREFCVPLLHASKKTIKQNTSESPLSTKKLPGGFRGHPLEVQDLLFHPERAIWMGRDIQYAQIAGPTVVVWQVIQYLRTPHSHLHNKQEIAMSCAPGIPKKSMLPTMLHSLPVSF